MSKYNTVVPKYPVPNTKNLADGEAFTSSLKLELVSILLTSFVKDSFYSYSVSIEERIKELVHIIPDKQFIAKAAIMARDWGMRSVTHVTIAELCNEVKGKSWLRAAISKVIQRPDDASEILSYWISNYGKPIPNALKRGIADGLDKFNEYNIAKYKGENHSLKMVDVVNLVHPKSQVFGKLISGTLETPYTWETEISKAGSDIVAKSVAWTELVKSGKLGYFALLRNLRNLETNVSDYIMEEVYAQLTDRSLIKSSKVLPFRYSTAISEVSKPKTREAISQAVDIACDNMPGLNGATLIAVDCSGSMGGYGSSSPINIARLFAAVMAKASNADVLLFGSHASWLQYNPADSITTIASPIQANHGGTNFHLIFDSIKDKAYDRIIILSDMQAWMRGGWGTSTPTNALANYKKRTQSSPNVWSFDLQGYGTLQFPEKKVFTLAGFSEKIFDIIPLIEEGDKEALLNRVKAVSIY